MEGQGQEVEWEGEDDGLVASTDRALSFVLEDASWYDSNASLPLSTDPQRCLGILTVAVWASPGQLLLDLRGKRTDSSTVLAPQGRKFKLLVLIISRCGPECLRDIPGSYCIYLPCKVSTSHVFALPSTSRAYLCHVGGNAGDQNRATDPNGPTRPYPPLSSVHHVYASSASDLLNQVRTKPLCTPAAHCLPWLCRGIHLLHKRHKSTSTSSWASNVPSSRSLSCCI